MAIQPYPIADFSKGLFEGREPWLSPQNAFKTVRNGRIYLGRLEKRRGFTRFSEVAVEEPTPVAYHDYDNSFPPFVTIYESSPNTRRIVPESATFENLNGASPSITAEVTGSPYLQDLLSDLTGFGTGEALLWSIVATGTSNRIGTFYYREGNSPETQAVIWWSLHPDFVGPESPTGSTMSYWYNPGNAIVGLANFQDANGSYTVAMDTTTLYLYDTSSGFFKPQATTGVFSGDENDYFWTWPLDSYLVVTNGVDPVHKWTPGAATPVAEMPTDFDSGSAGNDIDTALLVVRLGGRLVYLHTTENGTRYPRRARWTAAGSFETFDSALHFADAPANLGDIVTAGLIGSQLFVGFEKGWMELVSTGDPVSPLQWRPTTSRYGAASKLSTIPDSERLLSRGQTQMQALDPNNQYHIDEQIPDRVLDFSPSKTALSAAVRNEEKRAFWWTYVSGASTHPENILVAHYNAKNELAWSVYDIAAQVFATVDIETTETWDSFPGTWDDYTGVTWDSTSITSGFPQLIGGNRSGQINVFDDSVSDWGTQIEFEIETMELSPFPGQKTTFAFLDFYGTSASSVTLTFLFYSDTSAAAHTTRTMSLAPAGTTDKIYRRVRVDHTGMFHRFKIQSSDSSWFAIDALVPWFRPAGRVREFG